MNRNTLGDFQICISVPLKYRKRETAKKSYLYLPPCKIIICITFYWVRIFLGDSRKTIGKLCLSTKFPHLEISWSLRYFTQYENQRPVSSIIFWKLLLIFWKFIASLHLVKVKEQNALFKVGTMGTIFSTIMELLCLCKLPRLDMFKLPVSGLQIFSKWILFSKCCNH